MDRVPVCGTAMLLVAWPAALTVWLPRIQAPGMFAAPVTERLPAPLGLSLMPRLLRVVIGVVVWAAGIRYWRIARMPNCTAVKMARVTAMAGTVRRISIPAVTPRAKAKAV